MPVHALGEIRRRVEVFLTDEAMEREDLRFYLADLRDVIAAVTRRVSRNSLLIVSGAIVFILLSHGNLTEAELFGVKIQKFGFFRLAIPIVMAYASAHIVILMNSRAQLMRLYREFIEQSFPKWSEAQLSLVPLGNTSFFLPFQPLRLTQSEKRLADGTFYAEAMFVLFLPIAFGVYAYVSIFSDDEIGRGWAVASLLLTLGFVVLTFAHMGTGRDLDQASRSRKLRIKL
jgi:hypothetical protein